MTDGQQLGIAELIMSYLPDNLIWTNKVRNRFRERLKGGDFHFFLERFLKYS